MVIINDVEWPYYVMYYEKFKKVMQRTEKVAFTLNTALVISGDL